MNYSVFDDRACTLGEGPLWHPLRSQLFWFDILNKRLLSRDGDQALEWTFDRMVSAAGWVDHDRLLVGSERDLFLFDLTTETETHVVDLEATNPITRSNDGRTDPFGGFWIGTMGKSAEHGAGAIYRFYRGEIVRLYDEISIPNAISFTPDGRFACYTDTLTKQVMRQALDDEGWPSGAPELLCDLTDAGRNPDGAVFDAQGNLWLAEWGSARVACYDANGTFLTAHSVSGKHASCPAFGGPDLSTLFVTTARQGLTVDQVKERPENGMLFAIPNAANGQAEHRVRLD